MTVAWRTASLAGCLLAATACQGSQGELSALISGSTAVARETRLRTALADRDTSEVSAHGAPIARWVLPQSLREISGLALTTDGRVLAHGDEDGDVWEIDYRRGVLVKEFSLGERRVKGDFEGITIAHDVVYMLASNGKLYEFHEGANGAHVAYTIHDTDLKAQCEFEGVAFDPAIDALVLACKHVHDKTIQGAIVLYRWSLVAKDSASRLTRVIVPVDSILAANQWKNINPSDITIDPLTGNYIIIASLQKALLSITPAGALVFLRPLPASHPQPEGVAITKDGILLVSDEGGQGSGIITLYKWP
jgi:uncharacterized protein YjiK